MGGLFSRKEEEEEGERTVAFGPRAAQPEPGEHPFPDNYVVITKYSNFIELWVRFTFGDFFLQAANFYFLCIGILQLIPSVSTTGGVPTTFVPLTFVYLVSLTREVVEELARRREQYAMNVGSKASVFRDGNAKAMEVPWQDIHVGDIVKVRARGRRRACTRARSASEQRSGRAPAAADSRGSRAAAGSSPTVPRAVTER